MPQVNDQKRGKIAEAKTGIGIIKYLSKFLPLKALNQIRSGYGSRTYFDKFESQLSGAGSSPAGSIGRDLNSQKLHC